MRDLIWVKVVSAIHIFDSEGMMAVVRDLSFIPPELLYPADNDPQSGVVRGIIRELEQRKNNAKAYTAATELRAMIDREKNP